MCEAPEACGCLVSLKGMQGPWWGRGSEQRMASGYRRRVALRGEPEGGTKGGAPVRGRVLTRESVFVSWGCLNKVPTDWVASTTGVYSFTDLEARSLKSRCHVPSETLGESFIAS